MPMDNTLDSLYHDLEHSGITVAELPLQGGPCLSLERGRLIGVDRTRLPTEAQLRTALIHEEGHFDSGAFYTPFSPYQLRAQAEDRANRSAYQKRIPLKELRRQLRRGLSVWELADYFNVTPEFIWETYLFYKNTRGVVFAPETGCGQPE